MEFLTWDICGKLKLQLHGFVKWLDLNKNYMENNFLCSYGLWVISQPTPVFLPGESQGLGSLGGCRLWGLEELDTTEQLHFTFQRYWVVISMPPPPRAGYVETSREFRHWGFRLNWGGPQLSKQLTKGDCEVVYLRDLEKQSRLVGLFLCSF